MPPLRNWIRFLSTGGLSIGLGVFFVYNCIPSDERIFNELSPQLKQRYFQEQKVRERASEIMEQRMKETRDKPAWLQGMDSMRKFEAQVTEQARKEVEAQAKEVALNEERVRLRQLALKEKSL